MLYTLVLLCNWCCTDTSQSNKLGETSATLLQQLIHQQVIYNDNDMVFVDFYIIAGTIVMEQ